MSGSAPLVWIVDDDQDIRESLADVLRFEGYSVLTLANGREALTALQAGPAPELILLDLMMPGMDGYAFREAQRRDPRWANIPVIVITAAGKPTAGLDVLILSKPIDVAVLLAELRRRCAPR